MLPCFCSSPPLLQKKVLFREEYKLVLVHLQDNYWFIVLYLNLAQSADLSYVWWGQRGGVQANHNVGNLHMPNVAGAVC